MRALTFQAEGDVKVIDVPKPDIQASDEALVRVTLGAVCGSDLHILHGHTPMNPGAVLGHEFVGVWRRLAKRSSASRPATASCPAFSPPAAIAFCAVKVGSTSAS